MAEVEIKRTNFFDGQFLKQGEFLDMDGYHGHMRRRMLFVLFDKSGVIQNGPSDLTLEVVSAPAKQIRVKAGAALGMRPDLAEAKEIILRNDVTIDLTTVTPALAAGDTAIVTIHYNEIFTDPSNQGGVLGNTRVKEEAILTVHKNALPGVNAANGEPFVRLGDVAFTAVTITPPRDVAFLKSGLLATAPTLSVAPNVLTAGTSTTVTLTSSGGLSLAPLPPGSVTVSPPNNITISGETSLGPNSGTVILALAPAASTIPARSLIVGGVSASFGISGGLTLTGFSGVNEPAADVDLKINGSGFTSPTTIQFTKSIGLTAPVAIAAGNIAPNQIRIPMSQIPADAITGPVTVQSGGQTVVSAFSVVPPAVLNPIPATIASQALLTISGSRLANNTSVTLPGNVVRGPGSAPPFPAAALSEVLTDIQIVVKVPSATGQSARVRVTTGGGTVQSASILTVT